jgi:hypothetical protein
MRSFGSSCRSAARTSQARIALWKPLSSSLARSRRHCEVLPVSGGWLLARPSRQRRARSNSMMQMLSRGELTQRPRIAWRTPFT